MQKFHLIIVLILSMFCAPSEIINTVLKNNTSNLKFIIKKFKIALKFQAKQFLIKTILLCLFVSIIAQEPLGLLQFKYLIWVSQTICFRVLILFFKKYEQFWDSTQIKHA